MKDAIINDVVMLMDGKLDYDGLNELKNILIKKLYDYDLVRKTNEVIAYDSTNNDILKKFIACKHLDGLKNTTLSQYLYENQKLLNTLGKSVRDITTDDIRYYLTIKKVSKVTMNNKIRYISSFFNWLIEEELITKNPMSRIHTVKQDKIMKKPFTDGEIECLKCNAKTLRDKAIITTLLSTGCRVSEIVQINIKDALNKECVIMGKGGKQRKVYFSESCLYYIKQYLRERRDNNEALFVTNDKNARRMLASNVESMLRTLGYKTGIENVHPHRFRRTLACTLIRRGVAIQDVKNILGHTKLDTTLIYISMCENDVENVHRRCA